MPNSIKIVLFMLFISVFIVAGGTYLDMRELTIDEPYDYTIHSADLFWFAIICWVSWDLAVKKRDIRLTIIFVGLVIIGFNIWEYVEYGSTYMLFAGIIEAVIYSIVLVVLNFPSVKQWYVEKNS